MNNLFSLMRKFAPKYLLGFALILLAALIMSIIWPELRPELIDVESKGSESLAANKAVLEAEADPDISAAGDVTMTSAQATQRDFPVYLTGAIAKPGIYYLKVGAIMAEAVDLAGGLTDEAAADYVNLARVLAPHEMLRIPSRDEIDSGNIPPLEVSEGQVRGSDSKAELININEADEDLLCTLPGVGSATAKSIIAWRQEHGSFANISDIMQVSGIKEARFNQIKDLITI